MIRVEVQIARAARGFDLLDYLVACRIHHDDVVGLLIADEDQPRVLGRGRAVGQRAENNENRFAHARKVPPALAGMGSLALHRKNWGFRPTLWCRSIPLHYYVL
jgi:hypothetical protein